MTQQKLTVKNNDVLGKVKEKVDEAVKLEASIDKMDDAIKFLAADIGFLDIRVNYNNQGEIVFAHLLGSKVTHEVFKEALLAAVIEYRNELVAQFNNMKF